MKARLGRLFALSMAGAFAANLEGASARIELSGGPATPRVRVLTVQTSVAHGVTSAVERPIRPLEPGEMLVLGPTATPLSAPAIPPRAPVLAAPPVTPTVDTITVRAPASASDVARPPVNGESWESYRSGNVVRIALPRN